MLILLQSFLVNSCIEVIDFDTGRTGGILVIDGTISNAEPPYTLRLRETAPTERITLPVSGAVVTIFDNLGQSETYQEDADGAYLLWGQTVRGIPGNTYHIRVELPDGEVYESEPETIPRTETRLDSLYFDFERKNDLNEIGNVISYWVVNAYVDATINPLPGENAFFRWDVEEVYLLTPTDFPDPFGVVPPPCFVYVYPSGKDFQLLDGRENQPSKINGLKVATQVLDHRFTEKHYFTVNQVGLSEKAFVYWDKISQTVANVGSIFDTPPAAIKGNLSNVRNKDEVVLGYFGATSTTLIRKFLLASDLPIPVIDECEFTPWHFGDYPGRCLDCLSVPSATYKRPDFF